MEALLTFGWEGPGQQLQQSVDEKKEFPPAASREAGEIGRNRTKYPLRFVSQGQDVVMNADLPCTPEAVTWCYRIFLGRDPESDWVVQEKLHRLKAMVDICNEFVDSAEFFSAEAVQRRSDIQTNPEVCTWATRLILGLEPSPADLVGLGRLASLDEVLQTLRRKTGLQSGRLSVALNEPRKVVLLGNCQTDSLRDLLQGYTGWRVINWRERVLIDPAGQARIRRRLKQADIIITQQLSVSRFGVLATSELITAGVRPVVIPNLYFAGLYPEMTYLGSLRKRLPSPLGEYHSALACAAFLAGLTPEEALTCYDDDGLFAQAGLFDVWKANWAEYVARESRCDVKMADHLDAVSRRSPLFYTVNHPVGTVMDELTRRIVRHVTGEDPAPQLVRDYFQNNIIYPVWGPIVRRHRLLYGSPAGFYLPVPAGFCLPIRKVFLPLPDYLRQAYKLYAKRLNRVELPPIVLRLREVLSARYPIGRISFLSRESRR